MDLAFKLLFNKYTLGALALVVALWGVYSWLTGIGAARQLEVDKPIMQRLTQERDTARNLLDAARTTQANQADAHKRAEDQLKQDNAKTLAEVSAKLTASQFRERRLKEMLNGQVLVTPAADAKCVVPSGFIRLHNTYAEAGPDTPEPGKASGLPGSGSKDVDAPSGVALSTVGNTIAINYNECTQRGEVIDAWQTWYHGSLANYLKAVAAQASFQVVVPASP